MNGMWYFRSDFEDLKMWSDYWLDKYKIRKNDINDDKIEIRKIGDLLYDITLEFNINNIRSEYKYENEMKYILNNYDTNILNDKYKYEMGIIEYNNYK